VTATKLRPPDVEPLEVWDLPVADKLLQMWRTDASFPIRVASAVAQVRQDHPELAHVHLAGGGASAEIAAAIAEGGLPVSRDDDPFAAARAGAALVPGAGCADVGQTAVKLAFAGRAWRVDRDLSRAPLRDGVPFADRAAARATTIAALGEVLATTGAAQLVVALPCEFTPAGEPGGCTYCWSDPDPLLLAELARAARVELVALNDAELAAVAAAPHLPVDRWSLVLTIGFGVGAALRRPRAAI
jgi:hypothetical protein